MAINSLSYAGILHSDLALRIVVQSKDSVYRAKLIDFGCARFTRDKAALQEQVEDLNDQDYDSEDANIDAIKEAEITFNS